MDMVEKFNERVARRATAGEQATLEKAVAEAVRVLGCSPKTAEALVADDSGKSTGEVDGNAEHSDRSDDGPIEARYDAALTEIRRLNAGWTACVKEREQAKKDGEDVVKLLHVSQDRNALLRGRLDGLLETVKKALVCPLTHEAFNMLRDGYNAYKNDEPAIGGTVVGQGAHGTVMSGPHAGREVVKKSDGTFTLNATVIADDFNKRLAFGLKPGACAHTTKGEHPEGCTLKPGEGRKDDAGKPTPLLVSELMPKFAIREVDAVLEFGAKKYAPGNWRKVPNALDRYYDAALRHIRAFVKHRTTDGGHADAETGLHHLAHAVCCLLFLAEFDLEKK